MSRSDRAFVLLACALAGRIGYYGPAQMHEGGNLWITVALLAGLMGHIAFRR